MPHRRATTRADTSHAQGKARTNKRTRAATANNITRQKQGNPATAPNRHSHGASRHRIRNQRHHARQPHPTRGVFPSRARCAGHGPATGERETPEHAPQGRAHPDDAESRPNMAETRKREKPTPRPPEQRRGSPNRQEREPQRTAEESNLTRTIRANRLAVGPYTSQDYCPKEGKQNIKHKSHARRATRTRAPTAKRRTPTPHGRNQPLGYTPQCRPQHAPTRPYSTVLSPQYQSRESNPHAQPST